MIASNDEQLLTRRSIHRGGLLCTRLSRTLMPSIMAYRSGPVLWMTLPHMASI
jgi:hypothetical protein